MADPAPNILFVLADDLGYGDLGCYGHPHIRTPHIDACAQKGVRFTQFYAGGPLCSPSRAALLTGRTPYRTGVFTWIPGDTAIHLPASERTLPSLVREAGYQTCHVGKWHLNGSLEDADQAQPDDHGFEYWFATQNNAHPSHRNPVNFVRNGEFVGPLEGQSADILAEEALEWLEHRDSKRPFFLTLWTHEPHRPIESAPALVEAYRDFGEDVAHYYASVTQIDAALGRLLAYLSKENLDSNTLVIFSSDHGPEAFLRGREHGVTGGLRGRKRWLYEGGIRVPLVVRYPALVSRARICREPCIGMDLLPSVCALVGLEPPQDRSIDGADLTPLLLGNPLGRTFPLYWRWGEGLEGMFLALRQEDWKILSTAGGERVELYNLATDPGERNDLSDTHPELTTALLKKLRAVNAEVERDGPAWWREYQERPFPTPRE